MTDGPTPFATTAARMRQLQATSTEWEAEDPTLLDGEIAFSSDLMRFKVGPGLWSSLDYWGDPDAPEDDYPYAQQNGDWFKTARYLDYGGDLDTFSDVGTSFLRLTPTASGAWPDYSGTGSFVTHLEFDAANAIQIGYAWNTPDSATHISYQRVRRGATWGGWYTNSGYSPAAYVSSLNDLSTDGTFQLSFPLGNGVSDAWGTAGFGDVVQHTNIDAVTCFQIGYELKVAGEPQIWMRTRSSGVWSDWYENNFGITITESEIIDLNRVRWRNAWVSGTEYSKNDMVVSAGYLAVANTTTNDSPVPSSTSSPIYLLPTNPPWSTDSVTNTVDYGQDYTVGDGDLLQILAYRFWVPASEAGDPNYTFTAYYSNVTDPTHPISKILGTFNGAVLTAGWNVVSTISDLLTGGTHFRFGVSVVNSSTSSTWAANWTRDSNQNVAAPATGSWNRNNGFSTLRMSSVDFDSTSQVTNLDSIRAGSTIVIADAGDPINIFQSYTVLSVDGTGATYEFSVVAVEQGSLGEPAVGVQCSINVDVPIPESTVYTSVPDYYAANPSVTGYLKIGDGAEVASESAFGIDVQYQNLVASPDWDIAAITSGGALGGDGGGGGSGSAVWYGDVAPVDAVVGDLWYRTSEPVAMYLLSDDGDSTQWVQTNGITISGDYVLKSGDTMTGNLSVPAAVANANAVNLGQMNTALDNLDLDYLPLTGGDLIGQLNTTANIVLTGTSPSVRYQETDGAGEGWTLWPSTGDFSFGLLDSGGSFESTVAVLERDGGASGNNRILLRAAADGRYVQQTNGVVTGPLTIQSSTQGDQLFLSNTAATGPWGIWQGSGDTLNFPFDGTNQFTMGPDGLLASSTSVVNRAAGDERYLQSAGDTMTGTLDIAPASGDPTLKITHSLAAFGWVITQGSGSALNFSYDGSVVFQMRSQGDANGNGVLNRDYADTRYVQLASSTSGAVGDHNFLYSYGTIAYTIGATVAGSLLSPAGVTAGGGEISGGGRSDGTNTGATRISATRSGTWTLMGGINNDNGSSFGRISLFKRTV